MRRVAASRRAPSGAANVARRTGGRAEGAGVEGHVKEEGVDARGLSPVAFDIPDYDFLTDDLLIPIDNSQSVFELPELLVSDSKGG